MAYNEAIVQRIRKLLSTNGGITEKKMFGGLSFLLNGKMCCGVIKDDLVVRVGAKDFDKALTKPHVRPMDFTGRPLKGFVYVSGDGYKKDEDLKKWVELSIDFVRGKYGTN